MAERKRVVDRPAPAWPDPVPVKAWMSEPAVTIRAAAPVREAFELLKTRKIRHLPVVDERGRLVGIVTDRDLRQMVFDPAIQERLGDVDVLEGLTVREIMTWGVITVRPQTEIRQAARLMHEQKVGALPVTDAGRVVGMLTERDVLRAFETLIRERVRGVRPLAESPSLGEPYDYGFAQTLREEPWWNEGPGH